MKMKQNFIFLISFVLVLAVVSPVMAASQASNIVVLDIEGVINPFTTRYLSRGLDLAKQSGASAVVITLNTPGGLETSMREMVQEILSFPLPIIVYVTPAGARASSAGLFILMSGDIAAMTPATNVGAATPVPLGDQLDEVLSEKVLSDAAAFVRSLAERQGRNVDWVEAAVRKSISMTATEALEANVIDIVAEDLDDLLAQLDGRIVKGVTLELSTATRQMEQMNWVERFYQVITEPNIAYLLLSLGTLFLLAEISDPGLSFAGIGAVLCFIIGFMALGNLPVNWAAIGLLVVSLIMFVVALITDTEVVVTIAGLIPFVLGSLILFTPFRPESPALPELKVSLWLVIFMAGIIVFFSLIVLRAILLASKRPPQMGAERLIGREAVAVTNLDPNGQILIENQTWSANSENVEIQKGQHVQVVSVSGVRLSVVPFENKD